MMPRQMSSTWELEKEEKELGGEEGYTIRRRRRLCYPIASVLSPTDHPTSCVCLSLVLILVVKILGGGGTSSEDWYPLVLETPPPSRKTS